MPNTFNPPYRPKTTAPQIAVRETSNTFGDGYEQNVRDGINCVYIKQMSLTWDLLTLAQAAEIDTFFRNNAGLTFLWTLPNENTARKWRCSEWSPSYDRGHCSFSATLREVFA